MTTPLLLRAAEIIEREIQYSECARLYPDIEEEILDIARQLRERHDASKWTNMLSDILDECERDPAMLEVLRPPLERIQQLVGRKPHD